MKIRSLLLGLAATGLTQGAATAGSFDLLQIKVHPDVPEIAVVEVDGKAGGSYDKVITKTLKYGVYVRGDRPANAVPGTSRLNLKLDGGDGISDTMSEEWKSYTLTMPYLDPPRTSPVELCNDRLQALLGPARLKFLKNGQTITYDDAYDVVGQVGWLLNIEPGSHSANAGERLKMPAKIKCLGLNRDRKDTEAPSRTTEAVPPLFWQTTLKIEPAKMVRDGRYMCPSQLKLYGYVETGRKFRGKAIFMGPHYLSAITPLDFSYAGSRNVVATYAMKWHEIGGLTTTSDPKPKKQKLIFRFNISDQDGKLLKSVEETLEVRCNKIEVNMPAGKMGTPSN